MLSNAYFLAKFRFDTAENEPAKKLQDFSRLSIQAEYKFCPASASQTRRTLSYSRKDAPGSCFAAPATVRLPPPLKKRKDDAEKDSAKSGSRSHYAVPKE